MKCLRCGNEAEIPIGDNVCGNCADELRAEADAEANEAAAIAEQEAFDKYLYDLNQEEKDNAR